MLGVASGVLWAAGCTWPPKPAADPISRWELDETSSAEGVFEDGGPADVLMVHAGTWADLTTGSLVEGVGGTSAYTDGSAYATIPANVAAHNLAALTISFYYQRESDAAKHILFAAGNGSQVGDLSIEVQPDGRLRGWHTGQDGVLRFFESTNGVTGTNLQVGTAYRIDLTLGPQGARIYLDGAELPAAAIPENTNGWNNGRVKYLGRWIDGVQAPAVGVFDRLRIWNRQLTGPEIAQLQAAQSISLPDEPDEPSQPGDALSVPSLAEWLVSDEPDPAVTKYVSNQNRGNGSGSSPANAQEVQAALNSASPGAVLLAVCQTPGTIEFWNYPNGLSFPNGSAGNYITLQARNGDGVVINAGEAYGGARTPNSSFWTQAGLSQADIDKQIWRSVATFSGGSQGMIGTWVEFDHVHQIIPAGSMANLRTAYGTADTFTNYAGPCVHQDSDGRVYIRFQRPHPGKYSVGGKWRQNLWPGHPEAVNESGQLAYPVSENPNDYEIRLARQSPGSLHAFTFNGAGHVVIGHGINSCGFRRLNNSGADNVTMRRGTHITWQIGIFGSTSNRAENWDVQRARFACGSLRHLSRSEWKFGGPLEGIRSLFLTMGGIRNIGMKDCTIADYHELGVFGSTDTTGGGLIRIRNCTVFNLLDEGVQGASGMPRFEIGYCFFLNSNFYGPGANGTETSDPNPGEWLCHHNVMDVRGQKNINWAKQTGPCLAHLAHSPEGNQPKKMYNNLLLWGPDQEEETHLGLQHQNDRNNTATGTAACHEVFNNICIRHDVQRYMPSEYSDIFQNQTDFVSGRQHCDPNESNELYDYNLYYKDVPSPSNQLLREVSRGGRNGPGGSSNFTSLAAFHDSAFFHTSKGSGSRRGAYSPGFEANSTETKPVLPSLDDFPSRRFEYRPAATSAVTVAAGASLSGANWWSGDGPSWGRDYFPWHDGDKTLAPSPWKGPLDPNGTGLTVGVQNP